MSTKRRGAGDGTIHKRSDGRWGAQLRYVDVDGIAKRESFYGATRADVSEKLRAAQDRLARGRPPRDEAIRLDVYLEYWLNSAVQSTCKPSTFRNYGHIIGAVITASPIGHRQLRELRGPAIQAALCRGEGRERSRALALKILKHALNQAVRWHFIRENPAAHVSPPRVPRREMTIWSAAQARKFLKAAQDDALYALYYLALHTGLRQGELLALRWSDLDLKKGVARVVRTLDPIARSVSSPKTAQSRRSVSLGKDAVEVLRAHQRARNTVSWVFANARGVAIQASLLRRRFFEPLMERAGVPRIRFHDLRHTAATLMLEAGVPTKIVSERLGHSSIGITADVYQHVSGALERTAARAMTNVLMPRKRSRGPTAGRHGGRQGRKRSSSGNAKNPAKR